MPSFNAFCLLLADTPIHTTTMSQASLLGKGYANSLAIKTRNQLINSAVSDLVKARSNLDAGKRLDKGVYSNVIKLGCEFRRNSGRNPEFRYDSGQIDRNLVPCSFANSGVLRALI